MNTRLEKDITLKAIACFNILFGVDYDKLRYTRTSNCSADFSVNGVEYWLYVDTCYRNKFEFLVKTRVAGFFENLCEIEWDDNSHLIEKVKFFL